MTIADIHASMGGEADPTGDFAAGRTHFHATSEEFLACVDSQPYEHVAAGRTHFHATSEEFLACVDSQPYEHG